MTGDSSHDDGARKDMKRSPKQLPAPRPYPCPGWNEDRATYKRVLFGLTGRMLHYYTPD